MIAEYGTDATRYGLLKMSSQQDSRFSEEAISEGRALAIKLWNAARLVLMNSGDAAPALAPESVEERWILARIDATRDELEGRLACFEFSRTVGALYHLIFDDFCDWYLEAIKPRLYDEDAKARSTALVALERLLGLLHPVMPHVTEEIWSALPGRASRLIVSSWPEPTPDYQSDLGALDNAQMGARIYRRSGVRIGLMGHSQRIFELVVRPTRDGRGDFEAEIGRVRKEIDRLRGRLGNEQFVAKAPPDVVEAEREKLAQYEAELDALGG